MKLARTLLAVLTVSVLAACTDSVTAPQAQPEAAPAQEYVTSCEGTVTKEIQADGSVVFRCTGQAGSGG